MEEQKKIERDLMSQEEFEDYISKSLKQNEIFNKYRKYQKYT